MTVAMAAFNAESTIGAAVKSVITQSHQDWELLFFDDGSTDATADIVRDFKDPRITIISDGKRRGLAARLNQAIESARGRYIARMDADDIAFPNRLAAQMSFMEENLGVDLVGCGAIAFQRGWKAIGKFNVKENHQAICSAPEVGFVLAHPTWFGRRSWFSRFRYREDARRAQDQELLLRARRVSNFANLPELLLGYRQEMPGIRHSASGRWHYGKALWRQARTERNWALATRGTISQSLRGTITISAIALGLGQTVLRNRFLPLTQDDQRRWDSVIGSLERNATVDHA